MCLACKLQREYEANRELMRILYSMSELLKWLSTANPRLKGEHPRPTMFGLPDPNEKMSNNAGPCASTNAEIDKAWSEIDNSHKYHGEYDHYSKEERAKWQGMQMCMVCRLLPDTSLPKLIETFLTLRYCTVHTKPCSHKEPVAFTYWYTRN